MCLILLAHAAVADLPLVIAANRDEAHARPAAPAAFWEDRRGLLAGRDLQDGGTWLGVQSDGRFAAVTNYSEGAAAPIGVLRSRGELCADFLSGSQDPSAFMGALAQRADQYRGFSLLLGDGRDLFYFTNRGGDPRRLPPGIYGLSNGALDSAWPKVRTGKQALVDVLMSERGEPLHAKLFGLLSNREVLSDEDLTDEERTLSPMRRSSPRFIVGDTYGTRASTVIVATRRTAHETRVSFSEHSFGPSARDDGRVTHTLAWSG
jgi:uncharacterized protein with NRDE domain